MQLQLFLALDKFALAGCCVLLVPTVATVTRINTTDMYTASLTDINQLINLMVALALLERSGSTQLLTITLPFCVYHPDTEFATLRRDRWKT